MTQRESTSGRWEQIGANVRIALNDNYAVYLGKLDKSAKHARRGGKHKRY
jgi:hypothetical protein